MDAHSNIQALSSLNYDRAIMDINLAKAYFSQDSFGGWYNGQRLIGDEQKDQHVTDNWGNKIFLNVLPKTASDATKKTKISGQVLNQIASLIEENDKLISEIEYAVRGISPMDTLNTDIVLMAKYFRFYSRYADLKDVLCEELGMKNANEKDFHYGKMTNSSPLVSFAWICAAALAADKSVKIYVTNNVTAVCVLLAEICYEAGLTDMALNIIPFDENEDRSDSHSSLANIGTTMVVYKSSDLDSAADSVISAAWSHKGLLPWALKRILVQESAYQTFVTKLNEKLRKFEWNLPEEYKPDDVAMNMINRVSELNHKATSQKVECIERHASFASTNEEKLFAPTIFLDHPSSNLWKGFYKDSYPTPVVTMQAFRTTKEAICLVNAVPSWAMSLWCDNISICNEISLLVGVSCTWINCFGIVSPHVQIKLSHLGNIEFCGGKPGFFEYMEVKTNAGSMEAIEEKIQMDEKCKSFVRCVDKAAKLKNSQNKFTKEKRVNILIKMGQVLESKKDQLACMISSESISKDEALKIIIESKKYIYQAAVICEDICSEVSDEIDKKICLNITEPLGIVLVELEQGVADSIEKFIYCVVSAGLVGNTVIYKTCDKGVELLSEWFSALGWPVMVDSSSCATPGRAQLFYFEAIDALWIQSNQNTASNVKFTKDERNYKKIIWRDGCMCLKSLVSNKEILKMRFSKNRIIWSTFGETFAN